MDIQNSMDKAASLVRALDGLLARFSTNAGVALPYLRGETLRTLAGLYRGNTLARFGVTSLAEDLAVTVVIRDAATVREYLYEDCSFQISEPNQIIAEELIMASHSRPIAD